MTNENLASALAAFQSELPHIGKPNLAVVKSEKGSYKYNYADLSDISVKVLPLLAKHGLSFSAKPTLNADGKFVLEYTLRHASGDSDTGQYPLTATGAPQQVGSAITYARRYSLCAMTGVAPDEDDDGAAASQAPVQAERMPARDIVAETVNGASAKSKQVDDGKWAATMVDTLLTVDSADRASKGQTVITSDPRKGLEVSGLLSRDDREVLDVKDGAAITLEGLAGLVVDYVARHHRAVRADHKAAA